MDDEEFYRKYEAFERESFEDSIRRHCGSEEELHEAISFLIVHREMIRDTELERLEAESARLVKQLADAKRRVLLEEIACFKDVLALQRKLIEHGKPGN